MNEYRDQSPSDARRKWPSVGALWAHKRTKTFLLGTPILAVMAASELAEGKTAVALIAAAFCIFCAATLLRRANEMRRVE